ncbi:charged multivesicular body protein 7 [Centruroides vittatus]|uniref:charged multivesicular body protein 7 n=1 Tax=Centruroides vittatus TaxID=120091 RepID=UPI00350F9717
MFSTDKRTYLSEWWGNDVRMNSLMTEFRPKHINPFGYQEKMIFWEESLIKWCKHCKKVMFTHAEACAAFERKGRQPECLQTVIQEMINDGKLITEEQFLSSQSSWVGWAYYVFIKKPVLWSWTTTMNMLNWNSNEQKYISLPNLKEMSDEIIKLHQNSVACDWTDNVMSLDELWQLSREICNDQETFHLILCQLEKEKQLRIFTVYSQKFVKFRRKDESMVSKPTEVEINLRRLLNAKRTLDKEIEEIETEIENKRSEAKLEISKGYKNKASILLRHKKRLENILKKRISAVDNLESLLSKLQESKSEKAVLQAYQAGVTALKKLNLEGDFSLDKVDETMADIDETLEEQNAIEAALGKPIGFDSNIEVSESDLELELEDILEDDNSITTNIINKVSQLDIPTEEPNLQFDQDQMNKNRMKATAFQQ